MGGYSSDSWRMERFPGTVALQALNVHTERAVATGTGGVLPFGTAQAWATGKTGGGVCLSSPNPCV